MTLREEIKWIKTKTKMNPDHIHFAVDTVEGVHIGAIGLNNLHIRNKRATFGITIGDPKYWSHGYGTEAATLLIDYAFKKLKLHRLDLDVYNYNSRAIGLYKKLGFKKEAILREHNFYKGKYWDVLYMGLLNREWKGAPK